MILFKISEIKACRIILPICICVCLIIRISFEINHPDYQADKTAQIQAAYNLKNGHSVTIAIPENNDISHIEYIPLSSWPIWYSVLVALIDLFITNLLISSIIIDCFFVILLYLSIFFIFRYLQIKYCLQIIFFLFLTSTKGLFTVLTSTDLISLSLFSTSVAFVLYCVDNKQDKNLYITGSFITVLSVAFRFAYSPIVFSIPIALLFLSILKKNKYEIYRNIKYLIGVIIGVIVLYFAQKLTTNQFSYLSDSPNKLHFYFSNISKFDNFIYSILFANIDYNYIFNGILNNVPVSKTTIITSINVLTIIVSIFALYKLIIFAYHNLLKTKETNKLSFVFLVICVLCINILMLVFLSIISPPQTTWTKFWTYTMETRYFAPSFIFLFLSFILILNDSQSILLKGLVLGLIFVPILITTTDLIANKKKIDSPSFTNDTSKQQLLILNFINEVNRKYPIVIAENNYRSYLYSLCNVDVIPAYNYEDLIKQRIIKSNEPRIFLLIIKNKATDIENEFIHQNNLVEIAKINDSIIYQTVIQ